MSAQSPAPIACASLAPVVAADTVCREHVQVEFALPGFPASAPGQFLQVLCRDSEHEHNAVVDWPADGLPSLSASALTPPGAFLRRPFSIAGRWTGPDGRVHLRIISRTVGPGTRWLERLRPGRVVDITGPLGRGFQIPEADVALVLVGGGVGIPPLLYLARRLHELGRRDVTAFFGVTRRELLPVSLSAEPRPDGTPAPCYAWPGGAGFALAVTSDDGSIGRPGVVTDALDAWWSGAKRGRPGVVFACGPDAMLHAVARWTRVAGTACQLCIERPMGCGLGTCLSCCVRVRDPATPHGWRWKLACTDGPVFDRDDLLDYSEVHRA